MHPAPFDAGNDLTRTDIFIYSNLKNNPKDQNMDRMKINILPDGSIKITTDEISMPNHTNAEALITQIIETAGGDATRVSNTEIHTHSHEHNHQHHKH